MERKSTLCTHAHTHTHDHARSTSVFRVRQTNVGMLVKLQRKHTNSRHVHTHVTSLETQAPDCARRRVVLWQKQATSELSSPLNLLARLENREKLA